MKKILRIKKLNELLKYHQGHTLLELMATLDVEERTIRKDLKQIQEPPYNAIFCNEYRGKERLYRYKDITFNLPLFEENNEIKQKLDAAIEAVSQYEGTPQFDWLKICLMAIENGSVEGVGNIMSFESNADLEGLEHIKSLSDAIANKYPIKLSYKPYRAEEQVFYVHPYHLKQYNNRWFLIGKPEDKDVLYNYAIDRILSVEHLSKPYIDTEEDFDEYFDDIVGVSVTDSPVEIIQLMINKGRYPYIKTKPLHWSQKHIKEKDTEDRICVELKVKPNRELISLILSFGPDVIVTSPAFLRETIANRVKEMNESYNK